MAYDCNNIFDGESSDPGKLACIELTRQCTGCSQMISKCTLMSTDPRRHRWYVKALHRKELKKLLGQLDGLARKVRSRLAELPTHARRQPRLGLDAAKRLEELARCQLAGASMKREAAKAARVRLERQIRDREDEEGGR